MSRKRKSIDNIQERENTSPKKRRKCIKKKVDCLTEISNDLKLQTGEKRKNEPTTNGQCSTDDKIENLNPKTRRKCVKKNINCLSEITNDLKSSSNKKRKKELMTNGRCSQNEDFSAPKNDSKKCNNEKPKKEKKVKQPDRKCRKWNTKIKNYPIEPFLERKGPRHNLPVGANESSYLELFLTNEFTELAVTETNRHASSDKQCPPTWYPVTCEEIRAYFGILIYMGIVVLPTMEMYFNKEFVQCKIITDCMTFYRFLSINRYLHLTDNSKKSNDYFNKVRPALELTKTFPHYFQPSQNISVDEAMVDFQGRFGAKQYMPKKPTKWGLKAWIAADSDDGYVLNVSMYSGKKEERNNFLLLGEQVVLNMAEDFSNKNHHFYYDNFFTSVRLLDMLHEKHVYSCGTVRTNRQDWPTEFQNPKSLKLQPGEYCQRQSKNITATVWHDKRDVCFLSNNCDPTVQDQLRRRTGQNNERISISRPRLITQYVNHMNGVDLSDQNRSYYEIGRKCFKWWKCALFFVIDLCILNAFILFKLTNNPSQNREINQLNFRKNLISQLIGNFTSRRYDYQNNSSAAIADRFSNHTLIKYKQRKCVLCLKNKFTDSELKQNKRTSWKCDKCNVSLCKSICFDKYHNLITQ